MPNNSKSFVYYCALKEAEHNFLLLKCGLCIVTSLERIHCGYGGRKVTLLWRKLTSTALAR